MTTEELLRAGIAAAKANEIDRASKLLIQVVQADPNSESGWLWLGLCLADPKKREQCFRRVLKINPHNAEAARQIELLAQPLAGSQVAMPPDSASSRVSAAPSVESPKAVSPVNREVRAPGQGGNTTQQKPQKKDNSIFIWIGAGFVALILIGIAGFILFGILTAQSNEPMKEIPTPATEQAMTPAMVAAPTQNYTPVFEAAACKFASPGQARATCGFVIVPEDRSGDVVDTIRIAVAVFHSTSSSPKPDPILYLQGGPGAKAIEWSIGAYESVIAPLQGDRDFVVFDPRGVGFSEPTLDCDEFKATYFQDIQGKVPFNERASYYQGALLSCKNAFLTAGAQLGTYTSSDIAADAKDVLIALGYGQVNLYGVSYGTRVAQFMMRSHPELVRSAILDSVVPVEVQLLNQTNPERDHALRTLFDDCRSDPECSSAYPDLESVYNEVVSRLDAQPVTLEVRIDEQRTLQQVVDGSTFRDTVLWTLRTPQTIELAPQLIYRSRDGDDLNLKLSLALPILTFDSFSMGTYISVNCHDQVFAMSTEKLDNTIYEMCQLWGANPPLPGENDPVNSEIPTLIFAGKYDPVTPPAFAHQLAAHLKNSYVAEMPNQGHAPSTIGTSDCPTRIMSSFLQDPNTTPDLACINDSGTVKFVVPYSAGSPLALEPVTVEQYQINTRIPSGWSAAEFGFFNRNNSFGDVTQIGIQSAAVPESEWVNWLSTNFGGNQGLDQPAVKHDQRQANGLTWSIYETSSRGNPVDIAFASSNNQTLMILLISHKDEQSALYSTVFLPVIDATTSSR